MEYNPFIFVVIFLFVIVLGGALGGFLQAMRSTTSYKIRKLIGFTGSEEEEKNPQKIEYIDLGWFGFVLAGVVTSFMCIGLLTMSGSADFSPISKPAFKNGSGTNSQNLASEILIPVEVFRTLSEGNEQVINDIVKVVVQHNQAEEKASINGADSAFWTWIKVFSIAILGGFGGVGFISSAYNRYIGEDEFNQVQQKVDEDFENTKRNTLEVKLQRARNLVKNNQFDDAVEVCDEILQSIHPNHARAMGIKARALSRQGRFIDAISLLDAALSTADMTDSIKARVYWNIACYKVATAYENGLPANLQESDPTLSEIKTNLECALKFDAHLKLKLPEKEEQLMVLNGLKKMGIDWFDKLSQQ